MKNKDGFKTVISATIKDGGSMSMPFPVPKELEAFALSTENVKRGIEYYLLARYAFLHKMHSAFMINSFWAVEHLILSILIFKIEDKKALRDIGDFHSITKYWKEAKTMFPEETASIMSKFDDYVGKVKGYFSERYPEISSQGKLTYTGKSPRVTPGDDKKNKSLRFGKVSHLSLNELDHFVNFMLHDITTYRNDCSGNLMEYLASQDNLDLYRTANNYSIIYPNKLYNGEQS